MVPGEHRFEAGLFNMFVDGVVRKVEVSTFGVGVEIS